jgi:hypothetical protein
MAERQATLTVLISSRDNNNNNNKMVYTLISCWTLCVGFEFQYRFEFESNLGLKIEKAKNKKKEKKCEATRAKISMSSLPNTSAQLRPPTPLCCRHLLSLPRGPARQGLHTHSGGLASSASPSPKSSSHPRSLQTDSSPLNPSRAVATFCQLVSMTEV